MSLHNDKSLITKKNDIEQSSVNCGFYYYRRNLPIEPLKKKNLKNNNVPTDFRYLYRAKGITL